MMLGLVALATALLGGGCGGAGNTKALDLRNIDWSNVAVPGAACYRSGMVQLRNGSALLKDSKRGTPLPPGTGPRYDQLDDYATVVYGEVQPGQQNAIVTLECNNNSSTEYLNSIAVYSGASGKLQVVGLVTPRIQPSGGLPTALDPIPISPGTLVV